MTDIQLYPFKLRPVYQDYIWGGTRLRDKYGRDPGTPTCAESWEVVDRPEGVSVIENGPLANTTLRELMLTRRTALVGSLKSRFDVFPLLIKVIDAAKTLSIQVHPNDETAAKFGGEAKTEMWYVLDGQNDARVFAGFKQESDPDAFRAAVKSDTVADLLNNHVVAPNDAVFIPGGRMHAIGAGCLILEIQQNSNTTYRVYDWGRVGADGIPRPLHLEEALRVTRFNDSGNPIVKPERLGRIAATREEWRVLSCDFFYLGQIDVRVPTTLNSRPDTFEILFCKTGHARIECNGMILDLTPATSCLVPACVTEYILSARHASAEIMRILPGPFYMN